MGILSLDENSEDTVSQSTYESPQSKESLLTSQAGAFSKRVIPQYSFRLPVPDDFFEFTELAERFHRASPFTPYPLNYEKFKEFFQGCIRKDPDKIIIFLTHDDAPVGMIVGVRTELPFSDTAVAAELAWWVDEEHRGKESDGLRQAFEFWAKKVGCSLSSMALLEGDKAKILERHYRSKGYRKAELSFIKDL